MTVNSGRKVVDLNADRVDGIDSGAFLQKGVSQSANVASAGGVVDVNNTGTTNGIQGTTASQTASGVYGENTSGSGFGVAGRAGKHRPCDLRRQHGSGFAGYFEDKVHIGGALDCPGCVGASDLAESYLRGAGRALGQALAVPSGSISSSARRWRDSCGSRTSARVPPRALASSGFTTTPAAWRMSSSRAAAQIRPTTTWPPEPTSSFRARRQATRGRSRRKAPWVSRRFRWRPCIARAIATPRRRRY